MDSENPGQEEVGEHSDAARRQAALRALAESQTQQPVAGGAQSPTAKTQQRARATFAATVSGRQLRRGKRRGALVAAAVALVVVVITVAVGARFALGQRAAPPASKPVLRLTPANDNLSCITVIAWSPDGKRIAALGNLQGNCGGGSADSQTDAIFIYDATSGKLVQQLHPDPVVFDAPSVQRFLSANSNPASEPAMVFYQSLTWMPDSQALVMLVGLDIPMPEGQNGAEPSFNGLLRLGVSHASQTTLWASTPQYGPSGSVERWDLTDGKLTLAPLPSQATMYRWNSDGTLAPAGSAAGKPVGLPNKSQTFSIWQSGSLQIASGTPSANGSASLIPQDIQWAANVSAVSPDGRYFYPFFLAYGSLVPPSTKRAYRDEHTVEPHDAALMALATRLSASATTANTYSAPQTLVTWRPDGRLLASLNTNSSGDFTSAKYTVSIYDTRTGKLLKQLTPNFAGLQSGNSGNEQLQWSPDGSRLLLADNLYGAITIWGPGALPQG